MGETVHIICGPHKSSNKFVDWYHQRHRAEEFFLIISGGLLTNETAYFRGRLGIHEGTLTIKNSSRNDMGVYECIDRGVNHSVRLSVHGKLSVFLYNKTYLKVGKHMLCLRGVRKLSASQLGKLILVYLFVFIPSSLLSFIFYRYNIFYFILLNIHRVS